MKFFATRFIEEFLLYSSQLVVFFVVMLALIPSADALPPGSLVILTGFLAMQIALLTVQGHNPFLRLLFSFITPSGYALVRSLGGGFFMTDMGNVFLWAAALYVGLFQALVLAVRGRWLKGFFEAILAFGSMAIFVFLYFYLDLRIRNSAALAAGAIDLVGFRRALDIKAFVPAFLAFVSSPQQAFFVFGSATFAAVILGNRVKVMSLRNRIFSLFGEPRNAPSPARPERTAGEEVSVVVLSSDILDFTNFAAKLSASRSVDVLNRYYSLWGLVAEKYHGEVVGITGDSVIAVFGLLGSKEAAEEAVAAATEFFALLPGFRDDLQAAALPVLGGVSVGVHAGSIVAGDLGLPGQRRIGVFGEAVSVAARLDSLCREFKQDLLLSNPVFKQLGLESQAKFQRLGEVLLRNSTQPVPVFGLK